MLIMNEHGEFVEPDDGPRHLKLSYGREDFRPAGPAPLFRDPAICPNCGATFDKRRPHQKYCSRKCKGQWRSRVKANGSGVADGSKDEGTSKD